MKQIQEQPKARRVVKSFSLDPRLALRLEEFPSQSEVVKKALETWLYYYSLQDGELALLDDENYVYLAKTRWGESESSTGKSWIPLQRSTIGRYLTNGYANCFSQP